MTQCPRGYQILPIAYQNQIDNFIIFRAKKKFSRLEIRLGKRFKTTIFNAFTNIIMVMNLSD